MTSRFSTPMKCYKEALKLISKVKNIRLGRREILERALRFLEEDEGKKIFYIIRAPTGYGKTTFSYALFLHTLYDDSFVEKVIHVLPMRSIIEDAYSSAVEYFGVDLIGQQMKDAPDDPFLLKPLTFTTVDTFTFDLMKLNTIKIRAVKEYKEYGYDYFTQSSIILSAVILDEAHSILEERLLSKAFLTALNVLLKFNTPIFLMTATISRKYVNYIKKLAKEYDYIIRIIPDFDETVNDDYFTRERNKLFTIYIKEEENIENHIDENKRNLIVVNTVKRAQEIYDEIRKTYNSMEVLLIHGKFKVSHRKNIMKQIRELKNEKKWIIVSTQVIEAGVDISSDNLISDLSPPTALLQRMGRVARYSEKEGNITIIAPKNMCYMPYDEDLCKKTLKILEGLSNENKVEIHPRLPETYQKILDKIYRGINVSPYHKLLISVIDPLVRSNEVFYNIKEIIKDEGAFLRKYPISLKIQNDDVSIDGEKLRKIVKEYPGSIIVMKKGSYKKELTINEVDSILKKIAFWEDITLQLEDEIADKIYSEEKGLII